MRRREFMAGLGAAAGDAVFQRDQVYGQGSSAVAHRMVEANGIHLHIAEQGEGPLVVLCHGFPESWYSWRHQLTALSAAGFHAVAPRAVTVGPTDRRRSTSTPCCISSAIWWDSLMRSAPNKR